MAAGVRVPKPFGFFDAVLLMELLTDAAGRPAPRLGEIELSTDTARNYHRLLVQQVVCMLSVGLIHADLSEFNVLVAADGPVIIDLPQAVNAAANNGACEMLGRDVNNLRSTRGRFVPDILGTESHARCGRSLNKANLTHAASSPASLHPMSARLTPTASLTAGPGSQPGRAALVLRPTAHR